MNQESTAVFPKTPTGIDGLDEVTGGGFPKGRSTLVCGSAGCGKTLFGMQFLAMGILQHQEPGVFMSFEESRSDLTLNVKSLGLDLEKMMKSNKLRVDYVRIERAEIEETGEFDLEAGQTPRSIAALKNITKYCDEHLKGKYSIEIIDLLKNPQLAEGDQIFAIPTLVRKVPQPIRKIIGDLSNEEKVLVGLNIRPLIPKNN